ncbi:MAG: carbohydrate binding family 9 domain-containing protein [Myxococcales bacterium]|nr:carbohydrate binding family 9 domain-containing protein [Myxococcales bacterium]
MLSSLALWSMLIVAPSPQDGPATGTVVEPEERTYQAVRTNEAMRIDGRGTEQTWQRATPDDRFRERTPGVGAQPPVRTTLKVAYDDTNLYVLLDCESEPGDVIVRTLRRDNRGIFSDDTVYVKLDAAHNHRDAVSLGVNAAGAQIDALGLADGAQFITEWDAVWTAEVQRRDDGYTVEYKIPFSILGIKSAAEQTIGLNISRDHPSRNATYDWRIMVPPRSAMAASQFGHLVGLRDIRALRAIEYTPYVLARTNLQPSFTVDPRRRPNVASGGDLRIQVGSNSYFEGSLFTDFAQVEADEVQVARDRFPLFFPERRPFFINGLEIFDFGRSREAQLFFSRRVGLVGGQPVPILAGAKVYGRLGPVSYGLLQVQTLGAPDDPSRGLARAEPENVSVGRVRVQVTRGLNVGLMALGQHRVGIEHGAHAAGGVDAQLIGLDGKLVGYGFVASTLAQDPAQDEQRDADGGLLHPRLHAETELGSSASAQLQYNGLYVRPSLLWLWSDEHFEPRLGFYRRPGSSRQQASLSFVPRPRILGLRELSFGPSYSIETDPGYTRRLGQTGSASVNAAWRNGSNLGSTITHFVDDVQAPFELYGYEVEARRYTGFRHSVSANTPERRALQASASYEIAELFGGLAHLPSAEVTARLGRHFAFGASYTHVVGSLADAGEDFDFGYANANLDVAITRNLAFDNLGRLDMSPGAPRVGVQSRLRWRFAPGSDLFVVYRNDLPLSKTPLDEPPRVPFHEITVKLSYYLRAFVQR